MNKSRGKYNMNSSMVSSKNNSSFRTPNKVMVSKGRFDFKNESSKKDNEVQKKPQNKTYQKFQPLFQNGRHGY